jgi:poly-beta-hydroxybutyrate-responsive repressor
MTPPPPEADLSLPRNFLRPCLLLLIVEGATHGYELLEKVRALGMASADAAGVYRCLRAMDEEGLLASQWEPSSTGPARRIYTLTPEGRAQLSTMTSRLSDTIDVLTYFLERYDGAVRKAGTR